MAQRVVLPAPPYSLLSSPGIPVTDGRNALVTRGRAVLTYPLALLAAAANAVSWVLQRQANQEIPAKQSLSWRLMRDLLRRPLAHAPGPVTLAAAPEGRRRRRIFPRRWAERRLIGSARGSVDAS